MRREDQDAHVNKDAYDQYHDGQMKNFEFYYNLREVLNSMMQSQKEMKNEVDNNAEIITMILASN